MLFRLLTLSLSLFSLSFSSFAQAGVDLELTNGGSPEKARGGDIFRFTLVIRNKSTAIATNVVLVNNHQTVGGFVSGASSKGTCEFPDSRQNVRLDCPIGDVHPNETVVVELQMKLSEFGDISDSQTLNFGFDRREIASGWVTSEEGEINPDDNQIFIESLLSPSLNIPPRLEILSPKDEAKIKKVNGVPLEIELKVRSFDPDGEVKEVFFDVEPRIEIKEGKMFLAFGKEEFSAEEIEKNPEKYTKYIRTDLKINSKDEYSFSIPGLDYGFHMIDVHAVDNGGRETWKRISIYVVGDASVELITPQADQVFRPGSSVTIKALAVIKDPSLTELRLTGTGEMEHPAFIDSLPAFTRLKATIEGTEFVYEWRDLQKGTYELATHLYNKESVLTNSSEPINIYVAEERDLKIASLIDGARFRVGDPITIRVEARDIKGEFVSDHLEIRVNGKRLTGVVNSLCEQCSPKEYIWTTAEKGTYEISVRAGFYERRDELEGILGESRPIKIVVE